MFSPSAGPECSAQPVHSADRKDASIRSHTETRKQDPGAANPGAARPLVRSQPPEKTELAEEAA